ncbi:CLUMA_CG001205, isoform A [Clunio marinus]|uniref:CLUMA_CG001205, isoform A n=1 Tax=Clunio marinus TaxID=568069 RepID=A0A1J1HHN8_9DIPT|nr:CLUMA_CG001205, isoform A [Clunio marinus]
MQLSYLINATETEGVISHNSLTMDFSSLRAIRVKSSIQVHLRAHLKESLTFMAFEAIFFIEISSLTLNKISKKNSTRVAVSSCGKTPSIDFRVVRFVHEMKLAIMLRTPQDGKEKFSVA